MQEKETKKEEEKRKVRNCKDGFIADTRVHEMILFFMRR